MRRLTYDTEDLSYILNVCIFNYKLTVWIIRGSVERWHRHWGSLRVRGQSLNSAPTLFYIRFSIWRVQLTVLMNVACKVDINSGALKPLHVKTDMESNRPGKKKKRQICTWAPIIPSDQAFFFLRSVFMPIKSRTKDPDLNALRSVSWSPDVALAPDGSSTYAWLEPEQEVCLPSRPLTRTLALALLWAVDICHCLVGGGWGGGCVEPCDAKIRTPKSGESGRASAGEVKVGEEGGVNPTDQFDSPTSAVLDSAIYVSFPPITRRRRRF